MEQKEKAEETAAAVEDKGKAGTDKASASGCPFAAGKVSADRVGECPVAGKKSGSESTSQPVAAPPVTKCPVTRTMNAIKGFFGIPITVPKAAPASAKSVEVPESKKDEIAKENVKAAS